MFKLYIFKYVPPFGKKKKKKIKPSYNLIDGIKFECFKNPTI